MSAAQVTMSINAPDKTKPAPPPDAPMPAAEIAFHLIYSLAVLVGAFCWLAEIGLGVSFKERITEQAVWTVGALGGAAGAVHSLASLAQHAGAGTLTRRWRTFYLARPFTGAGVALVTMLVLKGGLGGFTVTEDIAILAWAALAGLYSQPALDKLKELFATIFKTDKSDAKDDAAPESARGRQ